MFNFISLDGFLEGKNRELDWHQVDDEFHRFAVDQMNAADTLLFGRVTYQMMADYWRKPEPLKNDPLVAGPMNSYPKFVFSKTLPDADWNNTKLIRDNTNEEIRKMKRENGKDILLLGSADFAATLIKEQLIDEFRIMINPVLLGQGNALFRDLDGRHKLRLIRSRVFASGNVLLCYEHNPR